MTITTPSHDRAPAASGTGEIPTQRTAREGTAPAVTATALRTGVVAVPSRALVAVSSRAIVETPTRVVIALPAAVAAPPAPTVSGRPAQAVAAVPVQPVTTTAAQAVTAVPVRVARTRTRTQPPRQRRWPAAVGGLAAGLTLGTVGAVGAVIALSVTAVAPAPTATAVTASPASISPNVSVPGRVLTAFDDGTWQVGVDIAPGTYMTTGAVDGGNCRHVLRTARNGGDITAHVAAGLDTVVLTGDDTWFATSGCATWNRVG